MSKPSGLVSLAKTATTKPIATSADDDEEFNEPTEDEVADDLEFTASSGDSLV